MLHDPLEPMAATPPTDDVSWRAFTQRLLARAEHELDRADEKANTLFRLYGVVLAAGVGFAVTGYSQHLRTTAAWLLLAAAAGALLAGAMLATALAPRDHQTERSSSGPRYYGDIVRVRDRAELLAALHDGAADIDTWLLDQLSSTCVIVHRRYRLIRRATTLTWLAIAMTVAAAVAQRIA